MSRRSIAIIASCAITWIVAANVATAQTAPPADATAPAPAATAPATTQAVDIPTDQSTPKSALRVLADAMEAGDREAILGVLLAQTPQETKMAQAMADLAAALAGLRKEAVAAFGDEGAKVLTGDMQALAAQGLARLAAASEKIDGDTATVVVEGDAEQPVNLVKQDGKWRYPVAEMAKGIDPAQIEKGVEDATAQTKLLREAAEEVRADKFETGEEVRQTLEQRVMQMVLARQKAATQPAPATQSAPSPVPPGEPKPAP